MIAAYYLIRLVSVLRSKNRSVAHRYESKNRQSGENGLVYTFSRIQSAAPTRPAPELVLQLEDNYSA